MLVPNELVGFNAVCAVLHDAGVTWLADVPWRPQADSLLALKRTAMYGNVPVMIYYCTWDTADQTSCGVFAGEAIDAGAEDSNLLMSWMWDSIAHRWKVDLCRVAEYLAGRD